MGTISDDASVLCMCRKAVFNVMPGSAHDVDVFLFVSLDACTGCCLIVTMMVLVMVCLVEYAGILGRRLCTEFLLRSLSAAVAWQRDGCLTHWMQAHSCALLTNGALMCWGHRANVF
jgi:hypothetical protein